MLRLDKYITCNILTDVTNLPFHPISNFTDTPDMILSEWAPGCHVWGCHTVLSHPSSGWVSITFRQDPSHSDDDITQYMQYCLLQYMASMLSCITICLCLS